MALEVAEAPGPMRDDRSWFDRPALGVARDLLGQRLVVDSPEGQVRGRIVETEAYLGPEDLAAHSARGLTSRNAVMFGPPGHLYVYLIYGIHHCLNVVCGPGGKPEAVLLRAAAIEAGEALARARRGPVPIPRLAAGPGNLAVAFGIDRTANGADLLTGSIRIADGPPPTSVASGPRIGVAYAGEWASRPYRFMAAGDPHISRR
jgi:DNA-3-methyladenine glycosylase